MKLRVEVLCRHRAKVSMSIFVTGGAGFIGANFILDWIAFDKYFIESLSQDLSIVIKLSIYAHL
jgi:hypothetical protein